MGLGNFFAGGFVWVFFWMVLGFCVLFFGFGDKHKNLKSVDHNFVVEKKPSSLKISEKETWKSLPGHTVPTGVLQR